VFSELRWEVIVRFDDIDGIVDHHCLNLLLNKRRHCYMELIEKKNRISALTLSKGDYYIF
jgi:hypothetical protein